VLLQLDSQLKFVLYLRKRKKHVVLEYVTLTIYQNAII